MGAKYRDRVRKFSSVKGPKRGVLNVLADYADDDGVAWPKESQIASDCGLSTRAIRRHLRALQDIGVIERVEHSGRGKANKWRILYAENGLLSTQEKRTEKAANSDEKSGHFEQEKRTPMSANNELKADTFDTKSGHFGHASPYIREPQEPQEKISRRSRRSQRACEHIKAAKRYGLLPTDFRVLVDAYLKACGTMNTANAETEMGERELNKAKDAAVTGLACGILEPADVEKRLIAYRERWGDKAHGPPYYSQIVNQPVESETPATTETELDIVWSEL